MRGQNPLDRLVPKEDADSLFGPPKRKSYTLNVDAQTHQIITAVAEQTGKTRPDVLAAFVEVGFQAYVAQAVEQGIDPYAPPTGNYKGAHKKKRKKRKKKENTDG